MLFHAGLGVLREGAGDGDIGSTCVCVCVRVCMYVCMYVRMHGRVGMRKQNHVAMVVLQDATTNTCLQDVHGSIAGAALANAVIAAGMYG